MSQSNLLVVVGYQNTNREGRTDEEDDETVDDGVESSRHSLARVASLTSHHGQVIGPGHGETGVDDAGEEAFEATDCVRVVGVRSGGGSGILPEPEAKAITCDDKMWLVRASESDLNLCGLPIGLPPSMAMKVKSSRPTMSRTLPIAATNSALPKKRASHRLRKA